ncbi:MAG: translational GTPase TypA [Alphaproteobacteria bacterium]
METRNIAIIAHVDHGKTTLVDSMFRQSGVYRDNQKINERALDRNDLEKERGITILAKCTSVEHSGVRINIVDTPGHADFGGEVERILGMVNGVILLVDAAEGPMPQTRFVTEKALALGLKPIVVINKIDRPDGRPHEVLDEIFDLFVALDASAEQLDFPCIYASGRDGWASYEEDVKTQDLEPLFETIMDKVSPPNLDKEKPFAMAATLLDLDDYLGRTLTGRIEQGRIKVGDQIQALREEDGVVEKFRVSKLLTFRGLERVPADNAEAGDIIAIAGLKTATVGDTLSSVEWNTPLDTPSIEPPTISMTIGINDSPLAGREGKKLTSRMIRDRLMREAEGNVAIKISETENENAFEVAGRGELQLGVLIETMRREGFELTIGRPKVLLKKSEEGGILEPWEELQVDVDEEFSGTVVESLSTRKAQLKSMDTINGGKQRLIFDVPARGLIGYQGQFLTETRGTGTMARLFAGYRPWAGDIAGRTLGAYVSNSGGKSVGYALFNLQERATMFIGSGEELYIGMIIGENSRDNDLDVNPTKGKQLTNIRASGTDENIRLTPPRRMTLEQAISYINDDECVEVTPQNIRLRKIILDANDRKKAMRSSNKLA